MHWANRFVNIVFFMVLGGTSFSQPISLTMLPNDSKLVRTGLAPNNEPEFGVNVLTLDNLIGGAVDDIVFSLPFPESGSVFLDSIYILQGEFEDLNAGFNFTQFPNFARIIAIHGEDDTEFGFSVANVGDLDRDGFGDMAVAAPFAGDAGVVYIIGLGTPNSLQISGKVDTNTISLDDPQDQNFILLRLEGSFTQPLRHTLGPSADIDNDGYSDVVLPAPAFSQTDEGDEILGYVIYGSEDILNTTIRMDELNPAQSLTILSPPLPDDGRLNINSNPMVLSPGDITGDGANDIIISLGYTSEQPYFASLYVLPGGERRVGSWVAEVTGVGDAQIDLPLFAERDAHLLNQIVGGDLNNDGVADLALSFLQADAKGKNDLSGAAVVALGGQDISGNLTLDPQSDRISILGHPIPGAQFGRSLSIRETRLLVGAHETYSPFIKGATTGAFYVSRESMFSSAVKELNAPRIMDAAAYGQFSEQGLGGSQDFFVDRSGKLNIVAYAAGDTTQPDRVGYILPLLPIGGDSNQDNRRDFHDIITISRFWQDALSGDGSTVNSLQILNAILGLQTY